MKLVIFLFSDFCNYRRQGYDYDALYDDDFMKKVDKERADMLLTMCPAGKSIV